MKQRRMLNFRVRDLDAMAAQLRLEGIAVEVVPEIYPNGRFARIYDPEGHPIELWNLKMLRDGAVSLWITKHGKRSKHTNGYYGICFSSTCMTFVFFKYFVI
jgi:hypothetical protein